MKRWFALLWFAALAAALADGGGQGNRAKTATRWGAMLVVERVSKVFENAIGEAPPELKGKRPVVFEVLRRKSPGPGPESWPPAMLEALGGRQEVCIAAYRSDGVLHWVLYSTEQPPALLGVFRRESANGPWIRCPDTVPQPDADEEDRVPAVGIDSRREPTTMVEEPGVSEAAADRDGMPVWSPLAGAKAEEGKVAFMGFDFGKEVEWEPGERSVPGDGPGSCLVRKFALASPWHGFESVLALGDVETRLPIALFFERFVPNGEPDSSKEDARRWFEEVLAAFPEECGVELDGGMLGAGYGEASGKTGGLEVRVFTAGCAHTRHGLTPRNGEPEPGMVWGRLYQVRVESAAAEAAGALGAIWLWSPVVGAKAEEGKVAFMGFDFGKEVEWEPGERLRIDAWPGRYLVRKFVLATPWHGFESVEAWGDVETRLPIALVFDHYVPDGSMEDAERWMEEMVAAFPEECGMELRPKDCGGTCREARGMKGGLDAWVCAGGYSTSRPVGESDSDTVWESERGMEYQVQVRRAKVDTELRDPEPEGF